MKSSLKITLLLILVILQLDLAVQKKSSNKKADILQDCEPDQNTMAVYMLENCKPQKYTLDLELDFEANDGEGKIIGKVDIDFEASGKTEQVNIDAWKLKINTRNPPILNIPGTSTVKEVKNQAIPTENWDDNIEINPTFGGSIDIMFKGMITLLGEDKDGNPTETVVDYIPAETVFTITIQYETVSDYKKTLKKARYTFLDAKQTAGKKGPYFYTQNAPIYARTVFPCIDSPAVLTELDLTVRIKKDLGLSVYTFAEQTNGDDDFEDSYQLYKFYAERIAPVQMTIVAGKISLKKVGQKTGGPVVNVLSDDGEILKEAAEYFKSVPSYINTVSEFLDMTYAWDRFDIVIMPPNYPYSESQEQALTLISQDAIKSERGGISTIFRTIGLNYFGNYVTNCNWSNTWVTEGIATWIERETQKLEFSSLYSGIDSIVGNFTLQEEFAYIEKSTEIDNTFLSLHPYTKNKNPEDGISFVPQEKGYQLMKQVQQEFLTQVEEFKFLKEILVKYRFRGIDYSIFEEEAKEHLEHEYGLEDGEIIFDKINWEEWINGEGYVEDSDLIEFTSEEYNIAINMANKFLQFDGSSIPSHHDDIVTWTDDMVYAFLDFFTRHGYMTNVRLIRQLDQLYNFKNYSDYNVKYRWFEISCFHRYSDVQNDKLLAEFMSSTGKMSFLVPVYEALAISGQHTKADDFLKDNYAFYHPVTIDAIEAAIFRAHQ